VVPQVKILIACECSGMVRDAFLARGHEAISCDLKPTQRPGPHLQTDVRAVLHRPWDMLIAHPVCRRLANSGVRWLHERPEYWDDMERGVEFFNLFQRQTHIPKRCIENPVLHRYALERIGRRATQYVQPWWFGSPFQKATGLWLDGLPALPREYTRAWYIERGIEIRQAVWLMSPGPDREEKRSETDPEIARAMAQYWG
jgi:hypothetical protein